MPNWNEPHTAQKYVDHFAAIRDKDESLAKMFDGTSETNLPTGAIRINSGQGYRLEKWDGSSWSAITLGLGDLSSNLTNLTNSEINQIANINSVSISNTQWGYLGGLSSAPLENDNLAQNGGTVPETNRSNTYTDAQTVNSDDFQSHFKAIRGSSFVAHYSVTGLDGSGASITINDDADTIAGLIAQQTSDGGETVDEASWLLRDKVGTHSVLASGGFMGPGTANYKKLYEDGQRVGPIEEAIVELGGDFDAGEEVKIVRVNDHVIISSIGPLTISDSSQSSHHSSSGAIPPAFRPNANTSNVFFIREGISYNYIQSVRVTDDGLFSLFFHNNDFDSVSPETNHTFGSVSISYLAA